MLAQLQHALACSGQQVRWPFAINWADPEAEGLVACYVATPGGMVDLVNATVGTRGGTEDPGRVTEYGGMDAYFDGNGDSYAFGTDVLIAAGAPFTIVWESFNEQIGTGFDSYPCVGTFARGVTSQPFRIVYSDVASYRDIVVGYTDVGGNADLWTLPSGITRTGMRHWGVWSYNGGTFATDANHAMWVNGAQCTNTGTPGSLASITDTTTVGRTSLTTTDWYGGIRQVRLYLREWNEADAIRFASNVYRDALFSPVTRPRRYFVPTSGATNLTIADAAHGHTADGLALTQAHQLAVQDAAHAHAADSLALTQAHALAVADATHAHAADNVVLSVEAALAIADALHGHVADGVALTQVHVLAVADALHAHAADGLTLDTATALQIADAVHGHLADSLGLTQAHVLAIAEALHAHTADQVTLVDPLERQETRGGRGYRGLLPYEEPFSADDLQKLDEIHEARRQALEAQQPKPAKSAKRAGKKVGARAPSRAKAAEPVEAKGLERPVPAAVIDSVVPLAKREQAEAVNALAIQEAEEEEEFAMVLMQVLLAA